MKRPFLLISGILIAATNLYAANGDLIVNGNVGIGTTNPSLAKLQVKDGDIYTNGGLGFYSTGDEGARNVLYRGGTDFTILRNYNQPYTVMQIWSPPGPLSSERETTLAMVRGNEPDVEYFDLYNNGYLNETQHGIRIQKRGTGQYRDFVFDQYDGVTKSTILALSANGSVGIGTRNPNFKLDVQGTIGTNNSLVMASDARFKKNLLSIENPIGKVIGLTGYTYEWKTQEYKDKGFAAGRHYGVIAQEIENVLPEVASTAADGTKAVAYTEIIPILIEAIKAQQKEIEELKNKISELR